MLYYVCLYSVHSSQNMQLFSSRKNSPKTHKNLVHKNLTKIFYDFLNKKPAKNFKIFQKLSNFTKTLKLKHKQHEKI